MPSVGEATILGQTRKLGIGLLSALLIGGLAAPVIAQTFDIHAPEAKKGELDLEALQGINIGKVKGDEGFLRNSHELKLVYGVAKFWGLEIGGLVDKPEEEKARLTRIAVENILVLRETPKSGIGLGFFAGVDIATHPETTNAATWGPIIHLKADKTALLLNPFFVRTFGQNHEEGTALNYQWQLKREIRKGFDLGLYGYGKVDNLGASPAWENQDHRVGPALFFGVEVEKGREIEVTVGSLFGVTAASPDTSVMVNFGVPLMKK
jgi:hypothetical protein